jgi:phenylacetic acid degradation operon negative regulatory protein
MSAPGEATPQMGLVFFAFGAAAGAYDGQLPGGQLTGRALIRLLTDLGLTESAARSLLLRMRREGWLDSQKDGRQARYSLAPVISVAQARIENQMRGRRPPWKGAFSGILYEVPEAERAFRDRFRRTAQLLGYVTLRPGLMIATADHWPELGPLLPLQPAGGQVLRVQIALSDDDSRSIAARLWHTDELAGRYRQVAAETRALTVQASRSEPGAPAFRAFAAATLPVYQVTADDPDLPAELLPAGWPGDELTRALGHALRALFPLVRDYLITVASA